MKSRAAAAALFLLLMSAGIEPIQAGPAQYIKEGTYVRAVRTEGVRLVSERVEMVSEGNDGENIHVRSTSVVLPGTTLTIGAGMPVGVKGEDFSMVWNFTLRVDGEIIPTRKGIEIDTVLTRSGERPHRSPVFLWTMDFRAGIARTIEVEYDVLWSGDDLGIYEYGANYIFARNTLWQDPPPETSLSFRLSTALPLAALRARPAGFFYGTDSLSWSFDSGAPLENVELQWSPGLFERFKGTFLKPYQHPGGDYFGACEAVTLFDTEFWSYFPEIEGTIDDPDVHDEILATLDLARESRDLILARSGKTFDDPEVAARFTAEPWYKPAGVWSASRLSEMEKLNMDYCEAVAVVLDEAPDLQTLVTGLMAVRERFW